MTKEEKQVIIQKVDEYYSKEEYLDAWGRMMYAIGRMRDALFDLKHDKEISKFLTSKQDRLIETKIYPLIEKLRDNIIECHKDCGDNPEPTKEEFEIYFGNKGEYPYFEKEKAL